METGWIVYIYTVYILLFKVIHGFTLIVTGFCLSQLSSLWLSLFRSTFLAAQWIWYEVKLLGPAGEITGNMSKLNSKNSMASLNQGI